MQENYLALDIGEKRIGVAIGSIVPFGKGYLDATDPEGVLAQLEFLITSNNISTIIVGVPRVRSGEITASGQIVLDWIERLKERFTLPIVTVDESYTSQEAENQLRAEKVNIKVEKGRVDERSAELILSQYINENKK